MAGLLNTIGGALNEEAQRRHRDLVRETEIGSLQLLVEIRDLMKENNVLLQQLIGSLNLENIKVNQNKNVLGRRNEGYQSRNK